MAGNYISVLFATWNVVSIYPVSIISQVTLVFIFRTCLCYARKSIFHIYGKKIFHILSQSSFTKFLRNLIVIFICEKSEVRTIAKAKYSILASILHIFVLFFLTEPHIYLYNTMCKSNGFLILCFESGNTFQKMWLFGKFHFVILFWIRSLKISFSLYLICGLWKLNSFDILYHTFQISRQNCKSF